MGGVFRDYELYKFRYYQTQNALNEILTEKEKLFTRTQPNAIRYDKEAVQGGTRENGFDKYLMECEEREINQRLAEAKKLLFEREKLLMLKERELRQSRDKYDVVYRMKYLDDIKIATIAHALAYSESQVYRIIEKIKREKLT